MDGSFIAQARAAWSAFIGLLGPNAYLQAAIIALLAMLGARLASFVIGRFLARLAQRSSTSLDDDFFAIVNRPVFMTVLLFGLALAASRLEMSERLYGITLSSLKSIAIVVWAGFAIRFAARALLMLRNQRDRFLLVDGRTLPLLQNTVSILIIVGAVYSLMSAWHIDVTALLASAGIIGLALSFAARDTLANVFAGVSILADVPYKIGDFVVLDSGERGLVTQIGIRSTRLLTRDDVEITIPNSVMGNVKITNESGGPHEKYRIRVKVGVAYGSDLEQVCRVLESVAGEMSGVCPTPAPRVRVRGFGDFGVDMELLCWVERPVERGRISHELHMAIYKAFADEDIEIPYPKHEVYVKPSAAALSAGHHG